MTPALGFPTLSFLQLGKPQINNLWVQLIRLLNGLGRVYKVTPCFLFVTLRVHTVWGLCSPYPSPALYFSKHPKCPSPVESSGYLSTLLSFPPRSA